MTGQGLGNYAKRKAATGGMAAALVRDVPHTAAGIRGSAGGGSKHQFQIASRVPNPSVTPGQFIFFALRQI
jgi:hypothetical protein